MNKRHDNRPIGVFDSGIGGLTVAAALARHMPLERLIYFGDTAHLPYGDKSAASIRSYSAQIFDFLAKQNCKAVVIACNTASAVAYDHVKNRAGNIPVFNVIDPTIAHVIQVVKTGTVGVIATKTTVNSGVYPDRIRAANPNLRVHPLATPLLVAMVEEGFFNNSISKVIIADYLSKPELEDVDVLILGCTHFPLIKKEIEAYYRNEVPVIDSSDIIALHVRNQLEASGLTASENTGEHHFHVSDLTASFRESTSIFFGTRVKLEEQIL